MIESTQDIPVDPEPKPFIRGQRQGVGCALEAWCAEFDSPVPES